jgi:Ca-activated chloride channel family protein
MIKFEEIYYLYWLVAIPVFFVLFYYMILQRKARMKKMGDMVLLKKLMPSQPKQKLWWKFTLYSFIYALIIVGLANPQIGSKLEKVERKGVDLMIALDVSNSMLAQDIKPDRLARAKRAISKLIDNLQGDRIGIVVFAGRAYTQLLHHR